MIIIYINIINIYHYYILISIHFPLLQRKRVNHVAVDRTLLAMSCARACMRVCVRMREREREREGGSYAQTDQGGEGTDN